MTIRMTAEAVAFLQDVTPRLQTLKLNHETRQLLLTTVLQDNWGPMPPWTTLAKPLVKTVETVTVGCGVAPVFYEDGRWQVLLVQAGPHYDKAVDQTLFMIPGGFANLSYREGSSQIPASATLPEDPRIAAAREMEEEFRTNKTHLFSVDPARLKPMDSLLLQFPWGEKRLVIGMMLQLTAQEVADGKKHIADLANPVYRAASAAQTLNKFSGKPESAGAQIFNLQDAAAGKIALLHPDQQSLFHILHEHLAGGPGG